ncbi:Nucleoporin-like protein amo1 [Dufourea novaeangliae]|uniref:Nucleoporin NUP42 n=1 Tax=Dufourea novaeangliae TaxID=178035 RepID=A0A154PQM9_DUFNO|nr:Nucleoporin-like protein amo1 [Dufourea novaeangliae]
MVVCKYYRQGNCRFGQYCQFEHINTFGSTPKVDSYNQDEFTAVAVAKEVLCAERGGQWLLSCFAPLKQKPPIPGMEDLSPEEVRWEMYQAQKNGMVEQAKLRFQQLCQDIKAKRDALKNPTRETIEMLKELQGTGQKSLPGSTPTSNVFGNKTFGSQSSPFSGGFTPISSTSIFGRTTTSNPVFGQTAQAFGNTSSIFGAGASQSVFVQPSVFGASSLVNNAFARPQTSATLQTTNSVFGTTAPSGAFSSGMFSQSKPAFGGAPVFGSAANFGNANGPMYGEQPAFGASNIFGGSNTNAPTFSSAAQSTNTFGATASTSSAVNLFGNIQTTPAISTSNAAPFGTATPTTSSPFASGTSQFEANSSTASPFSRTTFGITTSANETVGTTVTSSTIPFGITNTGLGFGTSSTTTSTFGEVKNSPFATTNTTATTTTTNPFALRTQQITSPFGNFTQSQLANTTTVSTSGPFGKSPFSVTMTVAVVDDSVYSAVDQLTDDEKSMYMAEKFAFGKIPLKPPPKDMR